MLSDERLLALWQTRPSGLALMRAVASEARREALEEAIKACNGLEFARSCVDAIRALKERK